MKASDAERPELEVENARAKEAPGREGGDETALLGSDVVVSGEPLLSSQADGR